MDSDPSTSMGRGGRRSVRWPSWDPAAETVGHGFVRPTDVGSGGVVESEQCVCVLSRMSAGACSATCSKRYSTDPGLAQHFGAGGGLDEEMTELLPMAITGREWISGGSIHRANGRRCDRTLQLLEVQIEALSSRRTDWIPSSLRQSPMLRGNWSIIALTCAVQGVLYLLRMPRPPCLG